jgi:cysteine synthase A
VVAEPDVAPLFTDGSRQKRRKDGSASESHPAWTPHPIQGWTPDFIPLVAEEALEKKVIDRVIKISGAQGISWSKRLAREEGIFTGISGGASFAAAMELAEAAPKGTSILAMLPDTGERYLSTPLFEGIATEMNEEEQALSLSTPGGRL